MENGRIPKDLLYGELGHGSRTVGRPTLCFKDSCKCDTFATGHMDMDNWETLAGDRSRWRTNCTVLLGTGESKLRREATKRRQRRKAPNTPLLSVFVCRACSRVCG